LLRGGRVLSPGHDRGEPVDILLCGETIAALGAPGALDDAAHDTIDVSDSLVLPGLTNGHTHSHAGLARGLVADRTGLEGFLACSGALNGARTVDDLRLSALLSAAELLRHGGTSCIDMTVQAPVPSVEGILAVADAYRQVGLRAVVMPMLADRTVYQAYPALLRALPEPQRSTMAALQAPRAGALMAACWAAQQAWPHDRALIQLGIGPTIPMHCSDALLADCARMSAQYSVPLQTHLLESRLQAVLGRDQSSELAGEGPVQRLQRLGCLGPRTTVAHGVWLTDAEIPLLQAAGVTLVHNPPSNLRLGSGVAPLRQMLRAGLSVAIGTDSSNTSDGQHLFEAIRLGSTLSRLASPVCEDWVSVDEVLALATQGGARALGLGDRLGRIAPGCLADLVVIDLTRPPYVPLHHLARQLVLGESGANVRRVFVNGRPVLADGRVLGIDEVALRVQAEAAASRLAEAQHEARAQAALIAPCLSAFAASLPMPHTDGQRRVLYP
jgi:guanine deaminase